MINVHYSGRVICKVHLADWLTSQGQDELAQKVLAEGVESLGGKWGHLAWGGNHHLREATAEEAVIIAAQEAAEEAERVARDAPREAGIARITGGLDRETVMAMARGFGGRGHWPEIYSDRLEVYNTSDKVVIWHIGADSWTRPICTRGNRDDAGAGYGANE